MQQPRRIYLFPPALEKFYVCTALVLLITFIALGSKFSLENHPFRVIELVTLFLFLNNVHTYFTFMLILFTPEFRNLFVEKLKNRKWAAKVILISSVIFAGAVYWAFHLHLSKSLDGFFIIALGIWKALHGTSQYKGLSLLANKAQAPFLTPEQRDQVKRVEYAERLLFVPFIWGIIAQYNFNIFSEESSRVVLMVISVMTLAASILINLNAFRYPRNPATNKQIFLINLVVFACSPFSIASYLYISCLHGLEYTFLCISMLKKSAYRRTALSISCAVGFFLILLLANFYSRARKTLGFHLLPRQYVPLLVVISVFSEYLHFYFDSEIYKMHDPIVRENLKPLLTIEASSVAV